MKFYSINSPNVVASVRNIPIKSASKCTPISLQSVSVRLPPIRTEYIVPYQRARI